jgi:hypothetical protein
MGSLKNEWMERQEHDRNKKIADYLGITIEELDQTEWEIEDITSEDGLIYGYDIVFDSISPKTVLNKIAGLENNRVQVDANLFSNERPDDE